MQQLVDLVGQDGETITLGQADQSVAALRRQRGPGGVLIRRYDVEQTGSVSIQEHRLQRVDVEAIAVRGYAHDLETVIEEDAADEVVGRLFHKDGVAGLSEDRGSQVDALGGAGGEEERRWVHGLVSVGVLGRQEVGQPFE